MTFRGCISRKHRKTRDSQHRRDHAYNWAFTAAMDELRPPATSAQSCHRPTTCGISNRAREGTHLHRSVYWNGLVIFPTAIRWKKGAERMEGRLFRFRFYLSSFPLPSIFSTLPLLTAPSLTDAQNLERDDSGVKGNIVSLSPSWAAPWNVCFFVFRVGRFDSMREEQTGSRLPQTDWLGRDSTTMS